MNQDQARALDQARAAHRAALAAFTATARAVPDSAWNEPIAADGWSPGQVAEHVRMSYEVVNSELDGGQGLRLRSSPWLRPLLRLAYLGRILRTRRFPRKVRAPREVRPGPGPFARADTLAAIATQGSAFEDKVAARWAERGKVVTHHVFGRLTSADALRLLTTHTEHHGRQISGALPTTTG